MGKKLSKNAKKRGIEKRKGIGCDGWMWKKNCGTNSSGCGKFGSGRERGCDMFFFLSLKGNKTNKNKKQGKHHVDVLKEQRDHERYLVYTSTVFFLAI